jgi:hypothetical protein
MNNFVRGTWEFFDFYATMVEKKLVDSGFCTPINDYALFRARVNLYFMQQDSLIFIENGIGSRGRL